MEKMKEEKEINYFETELSKYLADGINYNAIPLRKTAPEDLEQLASDSFTYGYQLASKEILALKQQLQHLQAADSIVRILAKVPELEPVEIADALKQAQSYVKNNPK